MDSTISNLQQCLEKIYVNYNKLDQSLFKEVRQVQKALKTDFVDFVQLGSSKELIDLIIQEIEHRLLDLAYNFFSEIRLYPDDSFSLRIILNDKSYPQDQRDIIKDALQNEIISNDGIIKYVKQKRVITISNIQMSRYFDSLYNPRKIDDGLDNDDCSHQKPVYFNPLNPDDYTDQVNLANMSHNFSDYLPEDLRNKLDNCSHETIECFLCQILNVVPSELIETPDQKIIDSISDILEEEFLPRK